MRVWIPCGIDLGATFGCGQTFRWRKDGDGWIGEIAGMAARVGETEDGFWVEAADAWGEEVVEAKARVYFDVDRDYGEVARGYAGETEVLEAFGRYPGLRVLRQPVFETVITFILSANNHFRRIEGIVGKLCEGLGAEIAVDGGEGMRCGGTVLRAFPEADAIARASEAELRGMGMGYRAPYVLETARRVAQGFDLAALEGMGYEEANARLRTLPGIGDKVADCILLFACGYMGAVPVDVWVERILRARFFPEVKGRAKLKRAAMARFGENAGIAQQVLFHAARRGEIAL